MSAKDRPRFLETITLSGEDMLVPIKDIKCVYIKYSENGSWVIVIQGENNNFQAEECFGEDLEKLEIRLDQIKSIIRAE